MTTTSLDQDVLTAAQSAAEVLPSQVPLVPGAIVGLDSVLMSIPQDAVAVHADALGSEPGTVVAVLGRDLVDALSASPMGSLPVAEALRPALEALRSALGIGALGPVASSSPAEAITLLQGRDVAVVPLQADGVDVAWLAVATDTPAPAASQSLAGSGSGMELLQDVVMEVSAELGRTTMTVRELLSLQPGAVVELDRLAGSPADLLVNGRLIARGEVVVVDEDYALKITELVAVTVPGRA
jgi:flagellar motor switch protein FliN/FliY